MQFFPKLTKLEWFILLGLVILYFVITTLNLTRLPIFVDEALYLRWGQIAINDANWRFISLTDGKQPLYVWLAGMAMKLISDPLAAGRMVSVIAGLFTMLGMAYTGFLIKDKKLGFLAATLAIFSPFLFFYNRFAVMEALLTAFGIWSFNLSFLLARARRLDLAMLLGMVLGFGMLVKSSAQFFFIFAPFTYLLNLGNKKDFQKKELVKYLAFILVSWSLAVLIYNIQRLSPWMGVIKAKNAFFTVPYNEIFQDPARLLNNTLDIFRWHSSYSTLPVTLLSFYGIYLLARRDWGKFLVLIIWTAGSLGGTAAIARLYAPRYLAFATPFVLIFAAYGLYALYSCRAYLLIYGLAICYPAYLMGMLIFNPEKYPFPKVDGGYVDSWSAGYGVKDVSEFIVKAAQNSDKKVYLYTEGTFGILPQGIELYINGLTTNLHLEGLYPINPSQVTPDYIMERSKSNPTYLLINNTQLDNTPPNLELVKEWRKAYGSYMRLYKVIPVP